MTTVPEPALSVGLRATVRAVVTQADTAAAMGSGDVPVLATPRLLALAEAAAVAAVSGYLDEGLTSVGTATSLEHKRASPVGEELVVDAELTEVAGQRLVFSFIARVADPDQDVVVGAGTVERVVVDAEHFLARARAAARAAGASGAGASGAGPSAAGPSAAGPSAASGAGADGNS